MSILWKHIQDMSICTLLERKVLSRTLKGSSTVHIGEPFEELLLVAGRTLLVPVSTWNQKGFYMEPKRVLPGTIMVLLWVHLTNLF
jgi:hypothetical protein